MKATPSLLVISAAPATISDGKPFLDKKFVEGMCYYDALWEGDVSCILKLHDLTFPFGQKYDPNQLSFNVTLLPADKDISDAELREQDVILSSGDDHEYLHLADLCEKTNSKLIYIIEYIPETRRQIVFLDPSRSLPRKLYSFLWTIRQEMRRRSAFRKADGIQANGYPAFSQYKRLNPQTMMYLDNRMGETLLATEAEMKARETRLLAGAPLRLLHSGRLEHLKGSQDLIPIARHLASEGVNFTLDIFGAGSLEGEIRMGITEHGLQNMVKLNGVVDFETELVPFARQHADIYLSCHRQSDPSCTYIENMGCGLAVVGYANRMWSSASQESEAGWVAPLGDNRALAEAIRDAASDRKRLTTKCRAARGFAQKHAFENEFRKRIGHLKGLADQP